MGGKSDDPGSGLLERCEAQVERLAGVAAGALALERMGRAGDLTGAESGCAVLETELERVTLALAAFAQGQGRLPGQEPAHAGRRPVHRGSAGVETEVKPPQVSALGVQEER
jgi:hypothetical protein